MASLVEESWDDDFEGPDDEVGHQTFEVGQPSRQSIGKKLVSETGSVWDEEFDFNEEGGNDGNSSDFGSKVEEEENWDEVCVFLCPLRCRYQRQFLPVSRCHNES